MADKLRDAEDLGLAELFASPAIADDGFSDRIVKQLRRRVWLRRLLLGGATLLGGAIAFRPLAELVGTTYRLLLSASGWSFGSAAAGWLPSLQLMLAGGLLFLVTAVGLRLLED